MNYWNLMKMVTLIFKEITILCFGAYVRGPYFWNRNAHFHRALTYKG